LEIPRCFKQIPILFRKLNQFHKPSCDEAVERHIGQSFHRSLKALPFDAVDESLPFGDNGSWKGPTADDGDIASLADGSVFLTVRP
jgi:hypothetical protein